MWKVYPKVDKSITFHYCIVICDVLRPKDVIIEMTTQIVSDFFCVSNFLKVRKFATFSDQKCFSFRRLCP